MQGFQLCLVLIYRISLDLLLLSLFWCLASGFDEEHRPVAEFVRVHCITGWAIALTCYISHSAKYRKMAEFDPSGSRNPWTDFNETLPWLTTSGTHPTTLVGVVQRGWSGQRYDLSHFWVSIHFCFLQHAPKSHFLADQDACFPPRVCLLVQLHST